MILHLFSRFANLIQTPMTWIEYIFFIVQSLENKGHEIVHPIHMSLLNILLLTNMYPFAPNNKIHLLNKCYMSYFTEFINRCDISSFMCSTFLLGLDVVQLTTPLVAPPEMVALRATSHAPRRVAYLSSTAPCALLCVPSQQARIWPYIMEN